MTAPAGTPSDPDAKRARAAGYIPASVLHWDEDDSTTAVWTRSVPTALPKTDRVLLFDDEGITPAQRMSGKIDRNLIIVPWSVLAAYLVARLQPQGTGYYVRPEDFPDEATRVALGKPLLWRLDQPRSREVALRRIMPLVRQDPAIVARAHELGELPVMLLVDPTEEFNWQHMESAPLRIELRERIVLVFLGRIEERVVYSAEPWTRLLPTN
jgi:hypothetical protein